MRILLMSRIIARTGVGNHIYQLYNELEIQGHEVWVASSSNSLNINALNGIGGYQYVNLNSHNPLLILRNLYKIHRIIKNNKIDIVHCHHRIASLYMRWYNHIWNCPYAYTLHSAPIPSDFAHRIVTSCGDQSIAISQEVGNFLNLRFKVPSNKISYVLNGVDESKLTPMKYDERITTRKHFGIDENKIVIALHSRITEIKGHMEVAQAVNMLSMGFRKDLVILCSGEKGGRYYDSLVTYIKKHNLDDNFVFCGWRDARSVIGCSDMMMLPSTVEGFGLNCIEAMFLNVPVARSKMGGYLDMSNYVYTLEEVSPSCIAKCLIYLRENKECFSPQINRASAWVHDVCTISAMTKNTVDVYKKVLKRYGSKEICSRSSRQDS